ncbi:hypothetical protein [Streptomyces sp. C10-9-1]|uniref:hypothetical protein n=1 Tax=Streptomyces sp. C10-9-1 TaxID=1859285 RepID=UPI003D758ABA
MHDDHEDLLQHLKGAIQRVIVDRSSVTVGRETRRKMKTTGMALSATLWKVQPSEYRSSERTPYQGW